MALDFPSSPTNGQVYGNYYYNSARGAWNALLPAATPNFFTNATLTTSTLVDATATSSLVSTTPLTVKGLSGQTANLQEWEDSASAVLAGINQYGGIFTGNRLTVGASSISTSAVTVLNTINAGNIGLIVKGSASQTANLQEWQNSAGTVLAKVEAGGNISGQLITSYSQSAALAGTAATVPLYVRAAASQTADLQQWQSSTGAVLSEINSAGELQVPRIGVGSVMPTTTMLQSTASAAGNIPIVAQAAASQTANIQEWQNSSGTALSYINKDGELFAKDLTLTKDTAHIELGGITGTANTPYIDFHSSAVYSDYNARIIADGGTASNASGNLSIQAGQLNLPTKTYMPGAIVQVQEFRPGASDKTASAESYISLISATFTTKLAGSKIYITYISGQMTLSANASNPQFKFLVDGTDQLYMDNMRHIFYGGGNTFRPFVTIPVLTTSTYSAGNHTIEIQGTCYSTGTITFDYQSGSGGSQSERRSKLIVMEVAQ